MKRVRGNCRDRNTAEMLQPHTARQQKKVVLFILFCASRAARRATTPPTCPPVSRHSGSRPSRHSFALHTCYFITEGGSQYQHAAFPPLSLGRGSSSRKEKETGKKFFCLLLFCFSQFHFELELRSTVRGAPPSKLHLPVWPTSWNSGQDLSFPASTVSADPIGAGAGAGAGDGPPE